MELQTRLVPLRNAKELVSLEGWLGEGVADNAEYVYPVLKAEDFTRLLNDGNQVIGAYCGAKLVGYILFKMRLNGTLNLNRLAVHHMYRRCGIASTLIDTMIERCTDFEDVLVTVTVPDVLTPFHLTLRRNGFKAITAKRNAHGGHDYVFSLLSKVQA